MDLVVSRHVESSQKRGSNLCPLHWQLDSYPPYHQESPCLLSFIAIYKRKRILHMTLPQSGKNLKSFLFLASLLLSPFTLFLSLLLSFFLSVYLFEETKLFVMSNVRHSGFCSSISMISVMSVTHFFLPLHFL